MLWIVTNMSTVGVLHVPHPITTLLLWAASAKTGGPLSHLDSPECVWTKWLCPEFVAIGKDPLLDVTWYGNGFPPGLLI